METERLYYNDPYLLEFDANIIETRPVGDRLGIILDKTAFYPTSGGQPNDLGTINGLPLVDCLEDEASGNVIHVIEGTISGASVHGRIDPARRADHMQQHSGQHVLSQAFVELFNWPTVSFHLGTVSCTIDLPVDSVSREQATKAQDFANRIVRENRPVAMRHRAQEQLDAAALHNPTQST